MTCSACQGPFHPATGHVLSANQVLCGPCARHWLDFLKRHLRRKSGGVKFYEHVETSIRPTWEFKAGDRIRVCSKYVQDSRFSPVAGTVWRIVQLSDKCGYVDTFLDVWWEDGRFSRVHSDWWEQHPVQ